MIKQQLVFMVLSDYYPYFQYVNDAPEHLPNNVLPLTEVLENYYKLVYTFDVDGVGKVEERGWYCRKKFPDDVKPVFVTYPGEDISPEEFEQLLNMIEL